MKHSVAALILGLGALASASPAEIKKHSFEVKGNALNLPEDLPAVTEAGSNKVTFTITNMQKAAISTFHQQPTDGPTPVGGPIAPGKIGSGKKATFVVPNGYKGNIAYGTGNANLNLTCASLIELSNLVDPSSGQVVLDVDVSYVDGFTDSAVCSCGGKVVTGCNKNLYSKHKCPKNTKFGQCCENPTRFGGDDGPATPFFSPCAGKAFTFPNDFDANSFGECQGKDITCCIGQNCPKNKH